MTPFIIAEIGSNWLTFEDCSNSITQAKLCGADAVKFQLFDHSALYGSPKDQGAIPMMGALNPEWVPKLAEKAKACDIEFMCTAFSPEQYEIVNPYVKRHKIASAELTHLRILQKVRSFNKPVILSTAAATEHDIACALEIVGKGNLTLMYCVGAYPARTVDLRRIQYLAKTFKVNVGYSDHSVDAIEIPTRAYLAGATIIEKHVSFINAPTPDSPHSLTGEEFKIMTDYLKGNKAPALHGPTKEESAFITRHKRRLIATQDIKAGEAFKENVNFGIYRSLVDETKALSGFAAEWLQDHVAKVDIKAGEGIGPLDIAD